MVFMKMSKSKTYHKLIISVLSLVIAIGSASWISHSIDTKSLKSYKEKRSEQKERRNKGRFEFTMNRLANPQTGKIPSRVREKELQDMEQLAAIRKSSPKTEQISNFFGTWTNAGPNDVGGRIRAVRYDANGSYLLAGGVHGGIWKSSDEGLTWTIKTDAFINPAINVLAQDPSNTANWFAFMGESNGSFANRDYKAEMYAAGLYKSTDHGETWVFVSDSEVSTLFPTTQVSIFSYVSRAIITSNAIFIGSDNYGLYKMSKDLTTIERLDGNNATAVNRFNANRWIDFDYRSAYGMVAAYSNSTSSTSLATSPSGIFYSSDDGDTWTDITPVDYDDFRGFIGRTLIRYADNEDAFYAMLFWQDEETVTILRYDWNNSIEEYEVTIDAYDVINNINDQYDSDTSEMTLGIDTQGEYNMTLAVYPTNSNIVFTGGTSLYRSTNGFETGPSVKRIGGYANANSYESYANHHPDQHEVIFKPSSPQIAFSAHDGGLSRTANVLATSVVWENRDENLNITQFYHVSMPRSASSFIIGGTQDNGSPGFEIDVSGQVSTSDDFSTGDGAFQYAGENSLFTSSQNGNIVYYKFEGETTSDFAASPNLNNPIFIHPFAVSLVNDEDIYVPDDADIQYQTGLSTKTQTQIDNGWQTITLSLANKASKTMTAISLSSTNPSNIIYGGLTAIGSATIKPSVVRIIESTQAHVEYEITAATAGSYINNIAVNPENGDEILVSISNYDVIGLFYSLNGGQTFTNVEGTFSSSNISNRVATITKVDGQTVYFIGTSVGVYFTTEMNGANTQWTMKNDGQMGYNVVEWMDSRASDGKVVAATHGRGLFILSSGVAIEANPFATTITGSAGYRMLSSPITGFTVSDISDNTAIQGVSGGDNNGFTSNFYYFGSTGSWSVPTDVNTSFGDGYGYIVKFFDNNDNGSSVLPITLDVEGDENTADVVVNLNKTTAQTDGETSVYYTLLGNPFTSNINLSGLSVNNSGSLSANVIVWDNASNDYATVSRSSGILAPWQGFWAFVLGDDASSQVNIPLSAKTTVSSTGSYFKRATTPVEGLFTLSHGEVTSQPFKVFLHDDAKMGFDIYDVSKFTPLSDSYAVIGGRQSKNTSLKAIESLPSDLSEVVVLFIEPQIVGNTGEFSINWSKFNQFPESFSIELQDSETGLIYDLRTDDKLSFYLNASSKSSKKNENLVMSGLSDRFKVVINPLTTSTDSEDLLPSKVELAQNYPNPFNPSTIISFGLPNASHVSLSIYNSLGQLVKAPINKTMQAGRHSFTFNASNLSSGVYLYRLESNGVVQTKKMLLVK